MSIPAVDWSPAWLAPYRALGEPVALSASRSSNAAALQAAAPAAGIVFTLQDDLPRGDAYEAHIFRTGRVPTRDNLHDFFNGLVWLHLPASKRRLNALQAGEIERAGIAATRGPLRDALTLFDENGALLDAPPALWDALIARDWQRLFVQERALWREARLLVFGHALLEKLTAPRKAATAHVLRAPLLVGDWPVTDAALAARLDPAWLAGKPFCPLPVLGIPGWNAENEDVCFYDDLAVFRPRGSATTTTKMPTPRRPSA